jgi:hypothetical protein
MERERDSIAGIIRLAPMAANPAAIPRSHLAKPASGRLTNLRPPKLSVEREGLLFCVLRQAQRPQAAHVLNHGRAPCFLQL